MLHEMGKRPHAGNYIASGVHRISDIAVKGSLVGMGAVGLANWTHNFTEFRSALIASSILMLGIFIAFAMGSRSFYKLRNTLGRPSFWWTLMMFPFVIQGIDVLSRNHPNMLAALAIGSIVGIFAKSISAPHTVMEKKNITQYLEPPIGKAKATTQKPDFDTNLFYPPEMR